MHEHVPVWHTKDSTHPYHLGHNYNTTIMYLDEVKVNNDYTVNPLWSFPPPLQPFFFQACLRGIEYRERELIWEEGLFHLAKRITSTVKPPYNEPCYDKDPVKMKDIWKTSRIKVKL